MSYSFVFKDGETGPDRFVRLFYELLKDGDLTQHNSRNLILRAFLGCGHHPARSDGRDDIETIVTNCAMTQGAALSWCGLSNRPGPGHSGWPMVGEPGHSWLGLEMYGKAWIPYTGSNEPDSPAIFLVQHRLNPNNCHVGAILEKQSDGSWKTAEGGGGDGSLVHYSHRTFGPLFDTYQGKHYRELRGWWLIKNLGLPNVAPFSQADPAPQSGSTNLVDLTNPVTLQHSLNLLGASPKLVEDGIIGPKTKAAVVAFQSSHNLKPDGIVGPKTTAAILVALEGLP